MTAFSAEMTVRSVVAGDSRTAAVFERHGIDYCCGGDRTIDEACREAGVSVEVVLADLAALPDTDAAPPPRFAAWDPGFLVDYIVANHHAYVRGALPTILAHTRKIAEKHGARHPELAEIARTFEDVAGELTQHMMKEEHILFPYVKTLAAQAAAGCPPSPSPFGTVANPIHMMEREHESAGGAMRRIRELSHGYRLPDDACETYQITFAELQEFERDLHQHVHLENNLLFPKAIELEGLI